MNSDDFVVNRVDLWPVGHRYSSSIQVSRTQIHITTGCSLMSNLLINEQPFQCATGCTLMSNCTRYGTQAYATVSCTKNSIVLYLFT